MRFESADAQLPAALAPCAAHISLTCPTNIVSTMDSRGSAASASTAGTASAKMAPSCLLVRNSVPMSAVQSASRSGAFVVRSHRLHRVLASCWQPGDSLPGRLPVSPGSNCSEVDAWSAARGNTHGSGWELDAWHEWHKDAICNPMMVHEQGLPWPQLCSFDCVSCCDCCCAAAHGRLSCRRWRG